MDDPAARPSRRMVRRALRFLAACAASTLLVASLLPPVAFSQESAAPVPAEAIGAPAPPPADPPADAPPATPAAPPAVAPADSPAAPVEPSPAPTPDPGTPASPEPPVSGGAAAPAPAAPAAPEAMPAPAPSQAPAPPPRQAAPAPARRHAKGPGTGEGTGGATATSPAASAPGPTFAFVPSELMQLGGRDFAILRFNVPPFLLPIYQAAGIEYGVPWEILAAINDVETRFGADLHVSSAGAVGWMQFLPSTWARFGRDANGDGVADPYNPVDAIFAAARYLQASGIERDVRGAILAYNHADWYADAVLDGARTLASIPADLLASLTGLTYGRFPVSGGHGYASAAHAAGATTRRAVRIPARRGAAAVAVTDGVIAASGRDRRLGRFVKLEDPYGNRYVYGHLAASRATARLTPGARVTAGTTIGRAGPEPGDGGAHVLFLIRPAGLGAPTIDPAPILQSWKLLRAAGLQSSKPGTPTVGQILLMTKDALARLTLADERVDIYGCGRDDVAAGGIDRRVLATLEFLASSGLKPTVTSLHCGHSRLTTSGNVSEHASGNAVDIAAINGIPVAGHQGAGSITELAIRRLLTLQGGMRPHQIISLMRFEGADNTVAMADHGDHIHVGFRPLYGTAVGLGPMAYRVLPPQKWTDLVDHLGHVQRAATATWDRPTPQQRR